MQTQTYAEIFEDIAETLTPENWRKGAYFKEDQGQLCMCAHGALQARVNPKVKTLLRSNIPAATAAAAVVVAASAAAMRNNSSASPQEIWNLRPSWIRIDYIYDGKSYGKTEAHYLLGMVGLTAGFNDAESTTLEMVKEKFREASKLARELGV